MPNRFLLGLYLGAFLGPFGGNVVHVLLPVLQRWYGVDVQLAALSVTAYMVPFAAGQFVSGALADRYGRRPVVVAGFAAFALASLLGALAPWYGGFLAARAGQGLANACTTPILMATLGDFVESRRLGRALGWFAAANTAGLFLAPPVSGGLALADWRLVYLLLAVVSGWLAAHYARWYGRGPGGGRQKEESRQHDGPPSAVRLLPSEFWSPLLSARLAALCMGAMLGYLSLNGLAFLMALYLATAYGLDPARSGLILSGFGLANMLAAGPAGWAADRAGRLPVSAAGALGAAAVLALLPLAPGPAAAAALLLAGGVAVAALWAGLTTLAVEAVPARRATASSLFNAWKFVGYAAAPLVYTPIYAGLGPSGAFGAAAGISLLLLVPLAALARLPMRPTDQPLAVSARPIA